MDNNIIRKCNRCNKKMRDIKHDFAERRYCKKCHKQNTLDMQLKEMLISLS